MLTQSLNIPQEFIMMILNEEAGYFHQVEGWTLNCATVGAVLADLSLRSRIDTDEKTLVLVDSTKTGDPVLDLCLEEIASDPVPKQPRYWIERLTVHAEDIIDTTLAHLIQSNFMTHHDGGFILQITVTGMQNYNNIRRVTVWGNICSPELRM